MTVLTPHELVERIWERDPTVWTGGDEAHWLGWLDEPSRMRERVPELDAFAEELVEEGLDAIVLLGMGGSSLAPEVIRRTFRGEALHVLDTTHPQTIRRLESSIDLERTLFITSSKSGTTLETRSHLDYFWERCGRDGSAFVAITDPGSPLEDLARKRGFRAVFPGEPTIGGRYSALSPFGIVPAALMGIDLDRFLANAERMADACRGDANPGLILGLQLGNGWRDGRDKVCIPRTDGDFDLWAEQLLAESTGKEGKGLVPAPGASPDGDDRQLAEVHVADPYALAGEFFRWEFATAVAGALLEINPFDQPNVQEAKDSTNALLRAGVPPLERDGTVGDLLAQARPGDYVAIQAFVDPTPASMDAVTGLADRARVATGCVVTVGLGPRYLHSTGQLHKGGPDTGLFLQVVDDPGPKLRIPGQPFDFGTLIRAQAAGDYAALQERGRRVARVRLEDL